MEREPQIKVMLAGMAVVVLQTIPAAVVVVLVQRVKPQHRVLQKAVLVGWVFNQILMGTTITTQVAAAVADSNLVMAAAMVEMAAAAAVLLILGQRVLAVLVVMQERLERLELLEQTPGRVE